MSRPRFKDAVHILPVHTTRRITSGPPGVSVYAQGLPYAAAPSLGTGSLSNRFARMSNTGLMFEGCSWR